MTQRIQTLAAIADAGNREDRLADFAAQVLAGAEPPPSAEEASLLLQWLARETSAYAQAFLWRLLNAGPALPEAAAFALRWLEQPRFAQRGAALAYLRRHHAELMPRLAERHATDRDAGVQYELAQHWLETAPDRAVEIMIDALGEADHEVFDAMTFDICEYGKTVHLERLRRLDEEAGGDSGYGRVAEALRLRLEGE